MRDAPRFSVGEPSLNLFENYVRKSKTNEILGAPAHRPLPARGARPGTKPYEKYKYGGEPYFLIMTEEKSPDDEIFLRVVSDFRDIIPELLD